MAGESQARMSDRLQLPIRRSHQHLSVLRYGREQYARIQGHLYERASAPMPRGAGSSRNQTTPLLFGAALSFFKALTRELKDSPIARVPCDG